MESVGSWWVGKNGGRNLWNSLNIVFETEQKLSFWWKKKSYLTKYTQRNLLTYRRKKGVSPSFRKGCSRKKSGHSGRQDVDFDSVSWLPEKSLSTGSFCGPPSKDGHMLDLCSSAKLLEATALGKEPVAGCTGCKSKGETEWKGPDNKHCPGKRSRTGSEDQQCKASGLKSLLLNFAVTLTSITALVNVEEAWLLQEAIHCKSEGTSHVFVCLFHRYVLPITVWEALSWTWGIWETPLSRSF